MIRNEWFRASRYVYNQCIEYLKKGNANDWVYIKANMKTLFVWYDWLNDVPYQIKGQAVKDACKAVETEECKAAQTGEPFDMKFRARKHPKQSCFIPKTAVKERGVYVRILQGTLLRREELPGDLLDCRLVLDNGRYFLVCPYKERHHVAETQGRVVALDPGIRSFLSFFSETSCGWLGRGDFGQIQRLCTHLDNVLSDLSKTKGKRRQRLRKAAARLRVKIQNLVDELHHKAARYLVDNFDIILLPTFETKNMVKRGTRKIRKKTARMMMTFAHYRFKQFLKHKAYETGKLVLDVNEAYTSKTCSWTGEVKNNLGGAKVMVGSDGQRMDRDINGARGIFLRALGDTPALQACVVE